MFYRAPLLFLFTKIIEQNFKLSTIITRCTQIKLLYDALNIANIEQYNNRLHSLNDCTRNAHKINTKIYDVSGNYQALRRR